MPENPRPRLVYERHTATASRHTLPPSVAATKRDGDKLTRQGPNDQHASPKSAERALQAELRENLTGTAALDSHLTRELNRANVYPRKQNKKPGYTTT